MLSLVGLHGGLGGSAGVVDGGQWVFFFFFFGFLINCVDGGSMRYFYFFVQCWFFILINCVGVLGLHSGDGGDVRERERERERETQNIERQKNILF